MCYIGDYVGEYSRGYSWGYYLEAHGTQKLLITGLITLLVIPRNGLIGVTPIIGRVIITVLSRY